MGRIDSFSRQGAGRLHTSTFHDRYIKHHNRGASSFQRRKVEEIPGGEKFQDETEGTVLIPAWRKKDQVAGFQLQSRITGVKVTRLL